MRCYITKVISMFPVVIICSFWVGGFGLGLVVTHFTLRRDWILPIYIYTNWIIIIIVIISCVSFLLFLFSLSLFLSSLFFVSFFSFVIDSMLDTMVLNNGYKMFCHLVVSVILCWLQLMVLWIKTRHVERRLEVKS